MFVMAPTGWLIRSTRSLPNEYNMEEAQICEWRRLCSKREGSGFPENDSAN